MKFLCTNKKYTLKFCGYCFGFAFSYMSPIWLRKFHQPILDFLDKFPTAGSRSFLSFRFWAFTLRKGLNRPAASPDFTLLIPPGLSNPA